MANVRDHKETAAELVKQKNKGLAAVAIEKEALAAEQQEWHFRKGQDLSTSETKRAMEVWIEQKVEELKPVILTEARRSN